jgi:hypothetical protein
LIGKGWCWFRRDKCRERVVDNEEMSGKEKFLWEHQKNV